MYKNYKLIKEQELKDELGPDLETFWLTSTILFSRNGVTWTTR